MVFRDPRCVFVCDHLPTADVVAVWLAEQGFPAKVMNRATLGGLLGLTVWSTTGVSADGIEVWVLADEHIAPAKAAIAEHNGFQQQAEQDKAALGPVDAECEECGAVTTFPAELRGSVQDCPECSEYMDVPGDGSDDFDWSGEQE